jgi:hypothetical protein
MSVYLRHFPLTDLPVDSRSDHLRSRRRGLASPRRRLQASSLYEELSAAGAPHELRLVDFAELAVQELHEAGAKASADAAVADVVLLFGRALVAPGIEDYTLDADRRVLQPSSHRSHYKP